ncbi:MAG TPA: Rid family hydrolase, partial [Terriglobia bacterium]|nr:Rid family hydrolase [Terriglobia bacterium]
MNPLRILLFTLLLVILVSHSWATDRQVVNPKDFKPHGRPYSPAIRAGNTLYISGQGSQNSDGKLSENFEERVRQCLSNVRA